MAKKTRKRRGFTASIVGKGGVGKTEHVLHPEFGMPRPLTLISADPNTQAIVTKFRLRDEEGFVHHKVRMPTLAFDEREDVKAEAEERWEDLRTVLRPLIKDEDNRPRSVVLDTATEMYMMGILATFGKNDQIAPDARRNMMGPVNSRWKGIIAALEQEGYFVALLHRGKPAWGDVLEETIGGQEREVRKQLTGPFDIEREGYNGTEFMVSTEICLSFDPKRKDAKMDEQKFGMKIVRSQQRPGLIGTEHWGRKKMEDGSRVRRASFRYLCTLLYPGTTLEDWA